MESKSYYVYILSNQPRGTLYIGVTSDLDRRMNQYKQKSVPGFSSKYTLQLLVYYERHESIVAAIAREKQLKNWHRTWKINLIESSNPAWTDLSMYDL